MCHVDPPLPRLAQQGTLITPLQADVLQNLLPRFKAVMAETCKCALRSPAQASRSADVT